MPSLLIENPPEQAIRPAKHIGLVDAGYAVDILALAKGKGISANASARSVADLSL
jgi:hypothetical protein